MKERLNRFMRGRYGADELSRFILVLFVICTVANMFTRLNIFYAVSLGLLVVSYYRMFSRDHAARFAENQKYLSIKNKLLSKLGLTERQRQQRKNYHIYRCPACGQKIRIPRGKGKICITCPKCGQEFKRKS